MSLQEFYIIEIYFTSRTFWQLSLLIKAVELSYEKRAAHFTNPGHKKTDSIERWNPANKCKLWLEFDNWDI